MVSYLLHWFFHNPGGISSTFNTFSYRNIAAGGESEPGNIAEAIRIRFQKLIDRHLGEGQATVEVNTQRDKENKYKMSISVVSTVDGATLVDRSQVMNVSDGGIEIQPA